MQFEQIFIEAEITTHDLIITRINRNICNRFYMGKNFSIHRIIKVAISRLLQISGEIDVIS